MLASSAPSLPGGSETFSVATWNIRSVRRAGRYALSCTIELCRVRTRAVMGNYETVG